MKQFSVVLILLFLGFFLVTMAFSDPLEDTFVSDKKGTEQKSLMGSSPANIQNYNIPGNIDSAVDPMSNPGYIRPPDQVRNLNHSDIGRTRSAFTSTADSSDLSDYHYTPKENIIKTASDDDPVHTGFIQDGLAQLNGPNNVFVSGKYAYVTSGGSNALDIIDISNPAIPVYKSSISNGDGGAKLNGPQAVFVSGNFAYIASRWDNALEIVNISNPAVPVHTGSIRNGEGGANLTNPYSVLCSWELCIFNQL